MTTEANSLHEPAPIQTSWLEKIKPNLELAAAIFSGVLILIGWLLDKNGVGTSAVIFYLLAFVIGGYAKAKEGIEDTIADKRIKCRDVNDTCCNWLCNYWLLDRRCDLNFYLCIERCLGNLYNE